jgi:hypothetical protein
MKKDIPLQVLSKGKNEWLFYHRKISIKKKMFLGTKEEVI